MVAVIITALLLVHGLIHAMGFAKAFGLAELASLTQPIGHGWGSAWGACAALLVAAGIARGAGATWWWMLATPGVVASQVLVVAFWTDAKAGTIVNVALLIPVLVGFGTWRFATRVDDAVAQLGMSNTVGAVVTRRDLADLPPPVARWLESAGAVDRPRDRALTLTQRGSLQTEPGSDWLGFSARQWFAVDDPGLAWAADVDGPFGTHLAGLDRYIDGAGSMRIEAMSLVAVVDATGPTIDQGALVRFLAETAWFPSAALAPYIEWTPIDDASARATMRWGDVEASGAFRFAPNGDVVGFEARRYRDDELATWIVDNDPAGFAVLGGVRVPTRSTVTWVDDDGSRWTWLRLEVKSIRRGP